jgi:tRNA (guanosine-2'-O-)-methyltransferase
VTSKQKRTFELLAPFMEEGRKTRITEVLEKRTKGLVLVLENLYDPHNISAILRSAEAMGLQYVYLAGSYPEDLNPDVSLGSESWLTVRKKEKPLELIDRLKVKGYKIAATVPSEDGIDPMDYKGKEPVALLLGSEHAGLSKELIKASDIQFTIPHHGFTKSMNVSVATAIFIYALLKNRHLRDCPLGDEERDELHDLWAHRSVPRADEILKEVKKRNGM